MVDNIDALGSQWLLHRDGVGWTMRSLLTAEYASVGGNRSQSNEYPDGTKVVVGTSQPSRWFISKENDAELSRDPTAPAKFRYG